MIRPISFASLRRLVIAGIVLLGMTLPGAADAAKKTQVTWYGQAAFKIETPGGGVILIDPWLTNPKNPDKEAISKLIRVDYILITHAHRDHVGNAVEIARLMGSKLVTSAGLRRNLIAMHGFPQSQAPALTSGNVGGLIYLPESKARVTIVNAVHGSEFAVADAPAGAPAIVTGGNPIGFVLEIDGGPTIYHTGDTDVFTDMKLIDEFFDVDLMLTAIGDHYTMGPARAALAVQFVRPKVAVPMHFGTFPLLSGRPAPFLAEIKRRGMKTKMLEMQPGETRKF